MTHVTFAATFPKVVVNTTTGRVEVHSGLRDAVAREGLAAEEAARIAGDAAIQETIDTHVADEAASVHGSTASATASKLVHRDADGRAKVAAPAAADDIAQKAQVDAEAAARIAADADLADAIAALDDSLAPAAKSGIAADVAFTPAGGISASDVQAAIEEAATMGGGGEGDGDMLASVYDPQDIEADAFDRRNHHGADWRVPVTPYDGFDGVGIGNSTKDTEALLAFAAHISENDVGKAEVVGNFLLEAGVVFGPDEGEIATKRLDFNALMTAVAPITNLVTFRRFSNSRMVGRLQASGTGGSSLDSNTCMHGITLDRCSRSVFDVLRAHRFRGFGVRNISSNDHFLTIGKVRVDNCGATAKSTRTFPITVTDFDKTGSVNIHQRSVLTVDDPANLPSAAHELRWGFVIVNGFPHKITEVDYTLGTLTVFPWLLDADEVAGEFQLVFGGGLRLGGQSAKSAVGSIDTIRCGTGLWVHGSGTPEVIGQGSQNDGVSIALGGPIPGNVFGGLALMGGYWEAQAVANIVHVNQTSSWSNGSTITGITSLSLPAVFSPRWRADGGVTGARRYFPVELTVNNRKWGVESEIDVWDPTIGVSTLTNHSLDNIPKPYPTNLRSSAATFTINLVDELDYRRLKGNVPVSVIMSGMGDRKGQFGGYNGTIVISAQDGYTINDSGFQSVEITGPALPARITAWLEDDGAGPKIWRVGIEEIPLVGASESTPVFPGAITDLAVVSAFNDTLTVEFTEATDADYYEYRAALEGSGAWGGIEELEGSADDGTFAGVIDGLDVNESYDVQVRGQNTNGPGPWSNVATGTTAAFPGDIDDLAVIETTATSATLRFTEPLDPFDADSYEVRFKLSSAGEWGAEAALSGSSSGGMFTGDVDSGLTTGEEHDFQVRGVNANGEGEWSNTATAKVQNPAWQQLLDEAQARGFTALYDPTNPNTLTPRSTGGVIHAVEIADGLGNLPPVVMAVEANQPRVIANKFGLFSALYDHHPLGNGGHLISADFATPITQPFGVMGIYEREGTGAGFSCLVGLSSGSNPRVTKLSGASAAMTIGAVGNNLVLEPESGTETPHTFFGHWDGANGEAWLDGVMTDSGGSGTHSATRVVLMERGDVSGNAWRGFCGPVLIYDGTLSAENRDGMFDLLHELSGIEKAE